MVRTRNATRLTLLVALGLLLLALSPLPVSDRLEERGGALISPATTALEDAVRPLSDVLLHAGQMDEFSHENAGYGRSSRASKPRPPRCAKRRAPPKHPTRSGRRRRPR